MFLGEVVQSMYDSQDIWHGCDRLFCNESISDRQVEFDSRMGLRGDEQSSSLGQPRVADQLEFVMHELIPESQGVEDRSRSMKAGEVLFPQVDSRHEPEVDALAVGPTQSA